MESTPFQQTIFSPTGPAYDRRICSLINKCRHLAWVSDLTEIWVFFPSVCLVTYMTKSAMVPSNLLAKYGSRCIFPTLYLVRFAYTFHWSFKISLTVIWHLLLFISSVSSIYSSHFVIKLSKRHIKSFGTFTFNCPIGSNISLTFWTNFPINCWADLISCLNEYAYCQTGESIFKPAQSNVQLHARSEKLRLNRQMQMNMLSFSDVGGAVTV